MSCIPKVKINQRFGRLVIIERTDNNNDQGSCWVCRCDCGNLKVISASTLTSGHTKSCGCLNKELARERKFKNLIGKTFGYLKVVKQEKDYINPKNKSQHQSRWLCKCKCGGEIIVNSKHLLSGATKSCGCLSESWIALELKKYYKKEYMAIVEYSEFINPETKLPLWYDIYLPKEKVFIEIHGQQHYKFVQFWHKTLEKFEYNKHLDKIKKEYAIKNGTYIEIDLRKIKTVEQAIEYIENIINKS